MIFLQIFSIDSIRNHIIDSVKNAQQISGAEILSKVDTFYNNAWTKLAILFGLVGALVPLIINYIQFKRNEKEKEEIQSSIQDKIDKEARLIEKQIQENYDNKVKELNQYLDERLKVMQHASEGVSYSIQARINLDKQKLEDAYKDYVTSLFCFFIGEDFANFQTTKKEFISDCLPKLTKTIYEKIDISYSNYHDINKLFTDIDESDNESYCAEIFELRKAFKHLP